MFHLSDTRKLNLRILGGLFPWLQPNHQDYFQVYRTREPHSLGKLMWVIYSSFHSSVDNRFPPETIVSFPSVIFHWTSMKHDMEWWNFIHTWIKNPHFTPFSNIPLPGSPCRGLCCTAATGELLDNDRLQNNDIWTLGLGLCILMTHTWCELDKAFLDSEMEPVDP